MFNTKKIHADFLETKIIMEIISKIILPLPPQSLSSHSASLHVSSQRY